MSQRSLLGYAAGCAAILAGLYLIAAGETWIGATIVVGGAVGMVGLDA